MLTLIRGVAGTGKSTLAKKIMTDTSDHFEADMFFITPEDRYVYDRSKIKQAHEWCQRNAKTSLASGRDVIVSNTLLSPWEIEPYIKMGVEAKVAIRLIECRTVYGNVHDVPPEIVYTMQLKYVPNSVIQSMYSIVPLEIYSSVEFFGL